LNIPRREDDPVEICEVCGAEFQGLYHCAAVDAYRPFDFAELAHEALPFKVLVGGETVGVVGPIKWSAREKVGISIIDPSRLRKNPDGTGYLLMPTGDGEE